MSTVASLVTRARTRARTRASGVEQASSLRAARMAAPPIPRTLAALSAQDPQIAVVFKRPFAEQVAFFRGKLGNLMPTQTWRDLSKEQNERGFMVAGAAKADLLADLAGAVDKAIAEGETFQAFKARFGEIVTRNGYHGWTGEATKGGQAWRAHIIYQSNLSTSYAAGRHAQLVAGNYPYWMWKHSGTAKEPRAQHLQFDGLVLPADHEFWKRHDPPYDNGVMAFGCHCRKVGVRSPKQAQRLGGDPDKAPPKGWDEGELIADSRPSADALDTIHALTPKLDKLPPQPSVALIQDWLRTETFTRWLANPQGDWPLVRLPDADMQIIGADIRIASMSPYTADKQLREHPDLTPREYLDAQRVVDAPTHRVKDERSLIYVREEGTEETGGYVLVVRATVSGKGLWISSYRRLSRDQAKLDKEVSRILKKGEKQ